MIILKLDKNGCFKKPKNAKDCIYCWNNFNNGIDIIPEGDFIHPSYDILSNAKKDRIEKDITSFIMDKENCYKEDIIVGLMEHEARDAVIAYVLNKG